MADKWTPKVEYGYEAPLTELLLTQPLPPYQIDDAGEGGFDKSASGIPEVFEVRRDYVRAVRIAFLESEYPVVEDWIHWAQVSATAFDFWFDAAVAGTKFSVFLETPSVMEGFRPYRDNFTGVFWIDLRLRIASGVRPVLNMTGF